MLLSISCIVYPVYVQQTNIASLMQEDLSVSEQLQMLQTSRYAAEVLEEVFIEGASVRRLALMGSKINLEGLERVSRDLTGTIYEAKLSG